MSDEKKVLMKTLKDENLRAETRKFTGNLIKKNKTTNSSFISSDKTEEKIIDNKSENNYKEKNINTNKEINEIDKTSVKKKKKIIKKKKEKRDGEKIVKPGEEIKKGQKYKLLTYKKLTDNSDEKINDELKNEEQEKKSNISKNNNVREDDKNKNIKEDEVKPIIKDKENKTNRTRKDLLNSLNNLQYNFDNLMAIGVHGTKYLNSNNQKK